MWAKMGAIKDSRRKCSSGIWMPPVADEVHKASSDSSKAKHALHRI
jgi:hypothetical protein